MAKTIEENMETVKGLVMDIRSDFDAKSNLYDENIVKSDTALLAMEAKFGEISENIQKQADEAKSSQDKIKELTLAISRGNGSGNKSEDANVSDAVKGMFETALTMNQGSYGIKREVMDEIVSAHVSQKFAHLSSEKKDVLVKSILAEGSQPAGGMWCPVPTDSRIRQRMFETSPMRQLAEVMNVNTKAMTFPLDDEEMMLQIRAEADAVNATNTPEFGEVRIDIHEIAAKPTATQEVLEDATINLEAWLSGKVSSKMARMQNAAFINGNGIKQARGILDYDDADVEEYERGKIGTAETAGSLAIVGDDLIDLQSHLLEDYQPNATWLMHRLIWAGITKLKDDEGQYLLNPMQLFQGSALTLLGAPVRMAGDMPKPTNAGALVAGTSYIAYGDFREGYTILDRLGINVIMDNITRSGFINWYFRTRYGAGVTNFQAFKRLKAKA